MGYVNLLGEHVDTDRPTKKKKRAAKPLTPKSLGWVVLGIPKGGNKKIKLKATPFSAENIAFDAKCYFERIGCTKCEIVELRR